VPGLRHRCRDCGRLVRGDRAGPASPTRAYARASAHCVVLCCWPCCGRAGISQWSIRWVPPHGAAWPAFFASFAALIVALRILIAWPYVNTGSVLGAQLRHASSTGCLVMLGAPGV